MKRPLLTVLFALLCTPALALAQSMLNAFQTVEIQADARKVWDIVSQWDNLHGWHPVFANTELTGGTNNTVGATRRLTVKDGPQFDEELLAADASRMSVSYRIIGENPLPITDYKSTLDVVELGANRSLIVWRGAFASKPGQKDDDNLKFISTVYRAGLDNVKKMAEVR
ncbi:MAG: SRPBCC family protein [Burkholderiales bacterium]|nr:SRPBCC family protein [Burkholderiales bacterium]